MNLATHQYAQRSEADPRISSLQRESDIEFDLSRFGVIKSDSNIVTEGDKARILNMDKLP